MQLRCKCGTTTQSSFHKDGYEVVKYICDRCRRANMIARVSNHVKITMSDGDHFYVKKALTALVMKR